MNHETPFVIAAILSDDVRTEANGKHIIIGTYDSEIGVPRFPVQLRFRLSLLINFSTATHFDLKIRLIGPSGDQFADFEGELDIERPVRSSLFPTIGFALPFSSEGSFYIESFQGDKWSKIGEWNVGKAEAHQLHP